ncbi:MAG TPA: hypothetical protein DEP35_06635 [Deltaproteobacteria bacterium]|jgi:hypothetical protein|nr:hypothetical protein [Deltaproteobacteria bacterium]
MDRWPWAALFLAAQLACGGLIPPTDIPVTEASLDEAAAVVRDTAARDPNFQLVEGGISVNAYEWSWRDRLVVEPMIVGSIVTLGTPQIARERVLVGPARYYVTFRELAGVAVRRWAIGSGIELSLDGATEPIFVEMKDAQTAQRLADALDVLRRARHGETPEEKGPPPSAGE